jgi:NitT/TauT family transport system ATP-binding protein
VNDTRISVKNLSVSYGTGSVLDGINLDVRDGEFLSIVGSSGSGKTTLLNALAGFIPSDGEVNLRGKLGVVFQDYSVFPWMTVEQNIAFGLGDAQGIDVKAVVTQHLRLSGLEDHRYKYPAQLSGGQTQRVGIARALAPRPDVVLMDEPYGALDRDTREKMQKWLLGVWSEEHKTIIFITHDIEEAAFMSDRVVVLNHKQITWEFPIPFARPRSEEIKFSSDFNALKKSILDRLKEVRAAVSYDTQPSQISS